MNLDIHDEYVRSNDLLRRTIVSRITAGFAHIMDRAFEHESDMEAYLPNTSELFQTCSSHGLVKMNSQPSTAVPAVGNQSLALNDGDIQYVRLGCVKAMAYAYYTAFDTIGVKSDATIARVTALRPRGGGPVIARINWLKDQYITWLRRSILSTAHAMWREMYRLQTQHPHSEETVRRMDAYGCEILRQHGTIDEFRQGLPRIISPFSYTTRRETQGR